MSKNEKGFYLFFDWIDRLKELSPEESIKIVYAICEYYRSGSDPTEQFEGTLKIVVALMFDQIKRGERLSELRAEAGQKGGFAKANSSKQKQSMPTYNNITNNNITNNSNKEEITKEETTTTTTTLCGISREEEFENVELDIMRYFAKEHFVSSAEDFIAYNKSREWKGIGGEDVRADYTRYADRWEDEELRKKGLYK